jgi:chitodextrinase
VQPNTTYTYTVAAYDAGLNASAQSTPASVTTPRDTSAPTAPSNLSTTFVGASEVRLSWSPSTDDVEVANYRIFRDGVQIGTSIMPSYNDLTVQPSRTYSYSVDAVDAAGNVSLRSNTLNVTTPAPPTTLTVTALADTSLRSDLPTTNYGSATTFGIDNSPVEHLLLKFRVAGVNGRRVESAKLRLYCSDPGGSGGVFKRVADTSWVESSVTWANAPAADAATIGSLGAVTAGNWYEVDVTSLVTGDGTFSLRASSTSNEGVDYRSKEGTAGFAPQLVVTVANSTVDTTPPSTPSNLVATAPNATQVDLVWSASVDNVGVTGYRIFRNGAQIATSTSASYTDRTVQPSTSYSYHVVAYDAAGNASAASNTATLTTPAAGDTTPPSVPSNLVATAVSSTRVDLTWGASSDSSGIREYRVFRDGVQVATKTTTSHSDLTVQAAQTYSYRVSAVDNAGNVSGLSTAATVMTPGGSTSVLTFAPSADAWIQFSTPTTNYGSRTTLGVDGDPLKDFLVKFSVTGVGSRAVRNARLRLYGVDPSPFGGSFARVANTTWSEGSVTWNTAPAADASPIASLGSVVAGSWYEVNLSGLITGDGTYSVRVSSSNTNGADYSSKEGTNPPQLVLDVS